MAVVPTYPGVYVQEVASGVRTIVGVSTSITLFLGRTGQGPLHTPIRCLNYRTFKDTFSEDTSVGDMARYVRLFFHNGGTDCYVMRIANRALPAYVTLKNECENEVLRLEAKHPGVRGESIRAEVTYGGPHPEATFNIRLFRWDIDSRGNSTQQDAEEWRNLSMNPNAANYAVDVLSQRSRLVNASAAGTVSAINGYSLSGRPIEYVEGLGSATATNFLAAWSAIITTDRRRFEISVNGSGYALVDLSEISIPAVVDESTLESVQTGLVTEIQRVIHSALSTVGASGTTVSVTFIAGPTPPESGFASSLLQINSTAQGDVFIRRSSSFDAAVPLMLGTEQGGLEVGAHSLRRPAPNGISVSVVDPANGNPLLATLAGQTQSDTFYVTIAGQRVGPINLQTVASGEPLYREAATTHPSPTGNNDGVREKLRIIRTAINANTSTVQWQAELWGHRLALLPTQGADNNAGTFSTSPDLSSSITVTENVRRYTVGVDGTGDYQTAASQAGFDGEAPQSSDYDEAYEIIDREVDLFNLLVLPPDGELSVDVTSLWSNASTFCEKRRAFLLMDPPDAWANAQSASDDVRGRFPGLSKTYSALFFPKLIINENGREVPVSPSGAIAGLMARIDNSRGVWKAPAGIEADLRGVVGVQYRFSDAENGILNPRGINTIRVFPNGIVNWGARTLDGDDDFTSEWKYIPIRRLALYIEESLYRGLKWVVFEPNDEPLWSQIRLNAGAFMQNLFRQGAFQGQQASDAYFVKCDAETTTPNDRNLGIVNIWVGFAPLKPAEFVILYLQQMAGQIQV